MQTFKFTANGKEYVITATGYQDARAQLQELLAAE